MPRAILERELQELRDEVQLLGSQVGDNLVAAVDALRRRDVVAAQRLIAADDEINGRRIALMQDTMTLIATQQPMAGDMRLVASILEISGELERINDYAKGIAKISLMIGPAPIPAGLADLPLMAEKARAMLLRALEAAAQRDAAAAQRVPEADSEVDDLFNHIYRELVTLVISEPDQIDRANKLEWVAHNLERAADRVTNICEWVIYQATGRYEEMDSEFEAPPDFGARER